MNPRMKMAQMMAGADQDGDEMAGMEPHGAPAEMQEPQHAGGIPPEVIEALVPALLPPLLDALLQALTQGGAQGGPPQDAAAPAPGMMQ